MRDWRVLLIGAVSAACAAPARVDLPQGDHAFAVTAGDVNGDGKVDLVATSDLGGEQADAVTVWLGRGDGSFEAPAHSPLALASRSESVLVADFDRDGRADAVTANTGLFTVEALVGNGHSSFQSRSVRATAEEPQQLAAGDLDGDGTLDAAVANRDDSGAYLSILFGRGNGEFSDALGMKGEMGTVAFGVALGDVNGDQKLDVVTAGLAGGARLRVHLNQGAGRFQPLDFIPGGMRAVTLADVDGDGRLDIVATEADLVRVLLGRGDGNFDASEELAVGAKVTALLVDDFDRDGQIDFAAAREDALVSVFFGAERRREDFATGPKPVGLAAADFDGDGKLEIVTANHGSPGSLSVLTL
jgi:hypothetical protein